MQTGWSIDGHQVAEQCAVIKPLPRQTDGWRACPGVHRNDGVRTLVVEDNPLDVLLLCEAVKRTGLILDLCVADNGALAITILDEVDALLIPCPELVVTDINLPRVPGFDVLTRIRASPKCGTVPVAVLTSSDSLRDRHEAARRGATAYIVKARDISELQRIGADLNNLLAH